MMLSKTCFALSFSALLLVDVEASQYQFQYPFRPSSFHDASDTVETNEVPTKAILTGVAVIDYDNDGYEDFVVQKGLFHNTQKGGMFVDVTKAMFGRPDALNNATGFLAADFDNDGYDDLLAVGDADQLVLWRNVNGKAFEAVSGTGLDGPVSAMAACAADVNSDGFLDIFVSARGDPPLKPVNRKNYPNRFFLNAGTTGLTFTDETESSKLAHRAAEGTLACVFVDIDRNGRQDLLAGNGNLVEPDVIQTPVVVYRNEGDGTFSDQTDATGMSDHVGYWMGFGMLDADRDGNIDFLATNLGMTKQEEPLIKSVLKSPNGLFLLKQGENGPYFEEKSYEMGCADFEFGWGASGADFNNDMIDDVAYFGAVPLKPFLYSCPGRLFYTHVLPGWDGRTYMKESSEYLNADLSEYFTSGSAFFDANNDGFADLVVATANLGADVEFLGSHFTLGWKGEGEPKLLINQANSGNKAISVLLESKASNTTRNAIGARLEMYLGMPAAADKPAAVREVRAGSSFASSESKRLMFGLGDHESANFKVIWPNGDIEYYAGVKASTSLYKWTQGDGHSQLAGVAKTLASKVTNMFSIKEEL